MQQYEGVDEFYRCVIDFAWIDGDNRVEDPSFSVLARDGATLFLSSPRGESEFVQAVVMFTDGVDALFRKFGSRG